MLIAYADHTDMQNMQMNAFSLCEKSASKEKREIRLGNAGLS